jgi:hypothetical protein
MNDRDFQLECGLLDDDRRALEDALWQAQLREYPDSRRVSVREAFGWMDETPDLESARAWWDKEHPADEWPADGALRGLERYKYLNDRVTQYRMRMARGLALALQFSCFVFYECGKQSDGTYRWRGCRYGVNGSEYLSGYSRD